MKEKNMRLLIVLALAVPVLVIIAGAAWWYISNHYIPMRRARPILAKLATENPQEIQKAGYILRGLEPEVTDEGEVRMKVRRTEDMKEHHPLEGIGAKRVERKILEILPGIEDEKALARMLSIILPGKEKTGLDFSKYGEEEWNIIKDAVDRYNAQTSGRRGYRVDYEDGQYTLQLWMVQF